MRVLLLNPPPSAAAGGTRFVREGRCMNRQSTWECLWPPLTLMYLSSILRKDGHETLLVDGMVDGLGAARRKAREFGPEMSILSTSTPTIGGDLDFAAFLKGLGGRVAILGVHPTALHLELAGHPAVDFVIRGEPEDTARELVRALARRRGAFPPLSRVRGITYKAARGRVRANPPRPFIRDLDGLPWPDRDSLDDSAYRMPFSDRKFTIIGASRGCPYSCTYCTASLYYGKAFRARSAPSVADEVAHVRERYGIRDFLFWADEFTFDRRAVGKLCRELLARKLDVRWFTNSRVDSADSATLKLMGKAGCWLISFGIESASQKILDGVRKGARVSQAVTAVKAAHEAGMKVIGHFIFGLPGETRETALGTIRFAKELEVDYAQFYVATPYAGTAFHRRCVEEGLIAEDDLSKREINNAVVRQGPLSPRDLMRLRNRAFREFYLRPSYLARAAGELAASPSKAFSALMQAASYLTDWGTRRAPR